MFHYSITQALDPKYQINSFVNELNQCSNQSWRHVKFIIINYYDNLYRHLDFIKSVIEKSHHIIPALNNMIYSCLYASWTLTACALQGTTYGLLFRSGFDIARAFDRLVLLPVNWGGKVASLGKLELTNLTLDALQALTEVTGVIFRSIGTFTHGFQLAAVTATPFVIVASAMGIAGSAAFMLNASLTSLVYGLYLFDQQALPGQSNHHNKSAAGGGLSHERSVVRSILDTCKTNIGLASIFNEIDMNTNKDLQKAHRTFYYELTKTGLSLLFLAGSVSMLLSLAAPALPATLAVSFAFSVAAAVGYLAFTVHKSYGDIYYNHQNESNEYAIKPELDLSSDVANDDYNPGISAQVSQKNDSCSIMSNLKMTLFGQNEHSTPCQNIEVQEIEMVETEMSDNKALMDCSKISSA